MLFLRDFFLFVCILSLTQAGLAFPMDKEGASSSSSSTAPRAAPSTPAAAASAAASAADVDQTPGKVLAQRLATTLQYATFKQTIGDQVDSWGIDWSAFARDPHQPHTAEKFLNLHRIMSKLKLLLHRRHDDQFTTFFGQVAALSAWMESVHLERLEGVTRKYFEHLFPNSEIIFEIKDLGVQLGTIAIVKDISGRTHKFYVKTHSEGKLADKSSAATPIAPKELLVYKILETLGFGPQVHFCARTPEDVYIATRDAGEGGQFFIFDKFTKGEDNLGLSLWGNLGESIHMHPWKSDKQRVEALLDQDDVAQRFASQLAALDILTRLLRLHDLLGNAANFGFFKMLNADSFVLRVFDFRMLEDQDLRFTDSHFGGFLEGNGLFRYDTAHRTISYLLHHRDEQPRARNALGAMEHTLQGLESAIEAAYTFVHTYLSQDPAFESQRDPLLERLTAYRDIIRQNLALFTERLQKYKREVLETQTGTEDAHTSGAGTQ